MDTDGLEENELNPLGPDQTKLAPTVGELPFRVIVLLPQVMMPGVAMLTPGDVHCAASLEP